MSPIVPARLHRPRLATVALLLLALVATAALTGRATPADAGSRPQRWTGSYASADWTEASVIHNDFGYFGNYHVGSLYAYQASPGKAYVDVFIADFDCPPGVVPDQGHGDDGETPSGPTCTALGYRYGSAENQAFSVDSRLRRATLTGQVRLFSSGAGGHGEEITVLHDTGTFAGAPTFSLSWNGTGKLRRGSSMERFRSGNQSDFYRSRYTSRDAAVSGMIGPMPFVASTSQGTISTNRSMYRSSSFGY